MIPTSIEYMLYDTMFEWGCLPDKWEKLHPSHQAMMMAFVIAKRTKEAYITDWYDKKNKK